MKRGERKIQRPPFRRSEKVAFALAAVIHVALFMSARRTALPSASAVPMELATDPIFLDLVPDDPRTALSQLAPPAGAKSATSATSVAGATTGSHDAPPLRDVEIAAIDRRGSVDEAAVTSSAPAPAVDAPANEGSWSLPAARPPVDLGLGAAKYGAAGAPSTKDQMSNSTAPANDGAAATNSVLAALDAHDVDAGLARGGPIVAAIEEATHSSEAPMIGVAVFDVSVVAGGGVTVDLVSADKEHEGWDHLRGLIAKEAAAKNTRLPPGGRGVRFRVRVEAVERLADGTDTRTVGKVTNNSHVGTMERTGDRKDMPHLQADYQTRVCHMTAGIDPLGPYAGMGCSPENLVPARRIVAARVISETRL